VTGNGHEDSWCYLGRLDYHDAMARMDRAAAELERGGGGRLLLLEHPPTITLGHRETGTSLRSSAATLTAAGITVARSDRGGLATYHGPGQLVGYLVFRLAALGGTIPRLVAGLQDALRDVVARHGIAAQADPERPGLWVGRDKLAAVGLRVRRGTTGHGFALNVAPDLTHYRHLVACGLTDRGVTSIAALTGTAPPPLPEVAAHTAAALAARFGLRPFRRLPEEDRP